MRSLVALNANESSTPLVFAPHLKKRGFSSKQRLTWEDLEKICVDIKRTCPETSPLGYFEYTSCWWENFFYTHGLDIIKKDHFETDIFTPAGLDAIDVMKRMTSDGLSENLTIRRDALSLLSGDKIGFMICNPRLLMEVENKDHWFFAPLPMKTRSVSAANAFIMSINANSENKELCEEALLYMLSEEFQNWLGAERAICPVRRSVAKSAFADTARRALPKAAETARMLPNQTPYWNVHDEISKSVHSLITGSADIEKMERDINGKLYQEHQEWGSMRLLGIA